MASELLLVVYNDGANYTYALQRRGVELAKGHTEYINGQHILCLEHKDKRAEKALHDTQSSEQLPAFLDMLEAEAIIANKHDITGVALRSTVPGGDFLQDYIVDEHRREKLEHAQTFAPQGAKQTLHDVHQVKNHLPQAKIIGVSDSAFHVSKPDYTWNYGLNLADADTHDVKRFGYHGIVVGSVIKQLKESKFAGLSKVVVCYLGSEEASVTAVYNGKSVDTTAGYLLNEGLVMANRSGTVDFMAGIALAKRKGISTDELATQLAEHGGLLGLSGSSGDAVELITKEHAGDHRAALAVSMYIYAVRQAIAKMAASLEGVDMLVFSGEVGQQSSIIRERIVSGLAYLGLVVSPLQNNKANGDTIVSLNPRTRSKPVVIVPAQPEQILASHARKLS